jgi:elongation factor P--beta-lysine ligase
MHRAVWRRREQRHRCEKESATREQFAIAQKPIKARVAAALEMLTLAYEG